jgi:hypothetical protein
VRGGDASEEELADLGEGHCNQRPGHRSHVVDFPCLIIARTSPKGQNNIISIKENRMSGSRFILTSDRQDI